MLIWAREGKLKQYVRDYEVISTLAGASGKPQGGSCAPKGLIFEILQDNSEAVSVLDIGFGSGGLGMLIRNHPATAHWNVDGIDGFDANCQNPDLLPHKIYRNVWHGLAQELPSEHIKQYRILCLLDVIEHLDRDTAKYVLRNLLTSMADDAYLFISTPLWFYPQDTMQDGDLEQHLIGVPASSMMSLLPTHYSIQNPLIGGFVFKKRSLDYVKFFEPTSDKSFSYDQGMMIANAVGMNVDPGFLVTTNL
jgi:2-polyprenyl-3-methyl-5-hydroxy-6-metoxy-1,4-benzoquinol methylase